MFSPREQGQAGLWQGWQIPPLTLLSRVLGFLPAAESVGRGDRPASALTCGEELMCLQKPPTSCLSQQEAFGSSSSEEFHGKWYK